MKRKLTVATAYHLCLVTRVQFDAVWGRGAYGQLRRSRTDGFMRSGRRRFATHLLFQQGNMLSPEPLERKNILTAYQTESNWSELGELLMKDLKHFIGEQP